MLTRDLFAITYFLVSAQRFIISLVVGLAAQIVRRPRKIGNITMVKFLFRLTKFKDIIIVLAVARRRPV